jgi:hypothetical protein
LEDASIQLDHRLVSILRRVRQDVATLLDKEAINAACREENYSWKNRLFNPANTVHLFITQILNQNTPLNDLPHKSGESFTGSAFCKARQRLPLGVGVSSFYVEKRTDTNNRTVLPGLGRGAGLRRRQSPPPPAVAGQTDGTDAQQGKGPHKINRYT